MLVIVQSYFNSSMSGDLKSLVLLERYLYTVFGASNPYKLTC